MFPMQHFLPKMLHLVFERAPLKRLYADLSLENAAFKDVLAKKALTGC
jgi:hypothetical protein